jgi:hypothetical protein
MRGMREVTSKLCAILDGMHGIGKAKLCMPQQSIRWQAQPLSTEACTHDVICV